MMSRGKRFNFNQKVNYPEGLTTTDNLTLVHTSICLYGFIGIATCLGLKGLVIAGFIGIPDFVT
jgi:hypothetical protein